MSENLLAQVSTHLSFLGYEVSCDDEDQIYRAIHPVRTNFLFWKYRGGILLTSFYKSTRTAQTEYAGYLNQINTLNQEAAVCRFLADKENDLRLEAWFPGNYDKTTFGIFMESWHGDSDLLRRLSPDLADFLD